MVLQVCDDNQRERGGGGLEPELLRGAHLNRQLRAAYHSHLYFPLFVLTLPLSLSRLSSSAMEERPPPTPPPPPLIIVVFLPVLFF